MNNTVENLLTLSDRKLIRATMDDFILHHTDEENDSFLELLVKKSILSNQIKPIQLAMEIFAERSAKELIHFKSHVAEEIVKYNKLDFIEQALLGTIIEKEEIFYFAGVHQNKEMIEFFCEHDYILIYHDWIKLLYINSYTNGSEEYIQYTKELVINKDIEITHKDLFQILQNAFCSLNLPLIEKISEEYNYSLASIDSYNQNLIFSSACTVSNYNTFYNKPFEQHLAMIDYLIKNDYGYNAYLSLFINSALLSDENMNIIADCLWNLKEKYPTLISQEFIDEYLEEEKIAQRYNILEEKKLLENLTLSSKEAIKIKKI
jgi:hypothetical protein